MVKRPAKTRTLAYDDIYRLREASDPRISPDGNTVAFVVTTADREADENRNSIWTVPTAGGDPVQLTQGTKDFHPRWSPDGGHLGFLRVSDDGPPQIFLLPSSGGEARGLTSLPLGAGGFEWSPDSSRLAVVAPTDLEGTPDDDKEKERRRTAPMVIRSATFKSDGTGLIGTLRSHLYVVDADAGEAQALTKNDISVATPRWSPDSKRIAFAASTDDRDITARTHLFVVGADGGEPDEVVHWGGTAIAPFFSPDGKTLSFVGSPDPGPGHSRLYAVADGGGEPTDIAPGFDRNVMIGGPAYPGASPRYLDADRVLFCARDRGCTNAYALTNGDVTRIAGNEERVVSGLSVAGNMITYVLTAPDFPADVFIASTDGSKEQRLTDLNRELLDEIELHRCEPRTFTAPDGLEIHGWLIQGDGPSPQPLLVDIHGGPHNAWSPTFDSVHIYHEQLAAEGWSILRLNPRGSDGYGEDFFTAVVGKWGEIDENDFLSAIDALVDEGLADPDRVGVCGYSYGGHMTNWLTGRHPNRFAAAVSGGCLSNITSFYGNSDLGFWLGKFEMGAEQYEARERFAELSPLSYVENVKTPTLVLHGENDDRCPVGQAEEWFVSLRRLGVESEFVRYPGGSHLFILSGRPSHRIDYNQRIADWVTRFCS
jgi:dipeptidyl aminopeptidase/acylaminoacyl peptidase